MICTSATYDTPGEANGVRRGLRAKSQVCVSTVYCASCDAYHLGPDSGKPPLSARRIEIARLAAFGHTDTEISKILGVTEKAVDNEICRSMKALYALSRTNLVAILIALGYIDAKQFVPATTEHHP